ncbi:general transcription factor IIE polypeptide 1 GTF2E1 [Cryptosporidium felis]|nr:general transcription factor IIE polypeptide 1 GTF2E1 [Cryptosporidium felis]
MNKQGSSSGRNYDAQQLPYNPENFKTFVQILLRLFHDSPAIIVGDCLVREQKSFTDRDLANKLSLSDRQVREALRQLEEDLIVVKDQKSNDSSSQSAGSNQPSSLNSSGRGGPTLSSADLESKYSVSNSGNPTNSVLSGLSSSRVSPSFYRINPYLPAVVEWQYDTIMHEIDQEIKDAVNLDELVCNRCGKKYSSLEALSLDLNPEDGLFLCRFCNEKLKSVDSASFRNAAKDRAERARSQLQILYSSLDLVKNMNVPVFPPYQSKTDLRLRNPNPSPEGSSNNSNACGDSDASKSRSPDDGQTVSKVKFGIRLTSKVSSGISLTKSESSKGISNKSTSASDPPASLPSNLPGSLDSQDSKSSGASKPPAVEEPTITISAIKNKVFRISEVDDNLINQMTDSEYLKYDELLQQHQTLGLINT